MSRTCQHLLESWFLVFLFLSVLACAPPHDVPKDTGDSASENRPSSIRVHGELKPSFKLHESRPVVEAVPLRQRYRLAGTFLSQPGEDAAGPESGRQAILDDTTKDRQVLVREGDRLDKHTEVVAIHRDRILLLSPSGEQELLLEYTGTSRTPSPEDTAERADASAPGQQADLVLERSPFGERVAEHRWVFEREALIRYADELQDDPERLAALFLAMQPIHNERGRIRGFQLNLLDEDVLYKAAGLQEGDIVLQVNSLEMNSAARAKYYIHEFLNDQIREFVFEVEREGEKKEFTYTIR